MVANSLCVCVLQTCLSGKHVRSWQSWWKACRASLPWVTIETVHSLLSSHQLCATSSSVCPDCLWSTATPEYLHWSVCEWYYTLSLYTWMHWSIKIVCVGLETGLVPSARRRVWHNAAWDPCGLPAGKGCLQRVPLPHQHTGYTNTHTVKKLASITVYPYCIFWHLNVLAEI